MKNNVKLLTLACCEQLLSFDTRPELRDQYNQERIDPSFLTVLNIPTKYLIDDSLNLGTSANDDCQSCIDLFTQLNHLDRVQANDKRLWVCLTHTVFFQYTRSRWAIGANSTDETIVRRFHFEGNSLEARMRNSISRLWWTAKITHDSSLTDPFELTKLIWERQDIHVALLERSLGTYPSVVKAFLKFYKNNKQLSENDIRLILRGINSIGGVKLLPLLDEKGVLTELQKVTRYANISING